MIHHFIRDFTKKMISKKSDLKMPTFNLDEFSCRIFVPRQSSKRRSWKTTFWKTFLQARWTSKPGGWGWFWIRLKWLQFFLSSGSRAGGGDAWEEGSQGLLCDQRRSSPDIYDNCNCCKKKVNFPSRIKDLVRIFQIVKNVVKNSPELKEETHFSKSMRFV